MALMVRGSRKNSSPPGIGQLSPAYHPQLEDTARNQFTSVPALVEETVVRLLGDAARPMESSPDAKLAALIRIIVNRSVQETFLSAALQIGVGRAVHEHLFVTHVRNDVTTCS